MALWKGTSFNEIFEALQRFSPLGVFLVFLCSFVQVFMMVIRIWLLFPKSAKLGIFPVAHAISYGQLVNMVFPARAGDVLKAVILSKSAPVKEHASIMTAAGVIIADKFVDIVALVCFILLSGAYRVPGFEVPEISAWTLTSLPAAALVAYLVWEWALRKRVLAAARWVDGFKQGLRGLVHPTWVGISLLTGIFSWYLEALAFQTLCSIQGYHFPLDKIVYVLVVLNVAIAVPISLANLGPFEASIVFALGTFNVPIPFAIAIATVHHSLQLAAICGWALLILVWKRFRPVVQLPLPGPEPGISLP